MEEYIEHVEKYGGIVDVTEKDNYSAARVYSKGDSRVAYFNNEGNFTGLVDSYGRVVVKDSVCGLYRSCIFSRTSRWFRSGDPRAFPRGLCRHRNHCQAPEGARISRRQNDSHHAS